jgi:hypothetical protein
MAGDLEPFNWSTTIRHAEELLAFGQKAASFLRSVSKLRILNGHFIDVTFDATDGVNARHSLGRPYYGVIVVRSTNAVATPMITVLDPKSAARVNIDPAKYVALGAETAFSATVTLWVF